MRKFLIFVVLFLLIFCFDGCSDNVANIDDKIINWEIKNFENLSENLNVLPYIGDYHLSKTQSLVDICSKTNKFGETYISIKTLEDDECEFFLFKSSVDGFEKISSEKLSPLYLSTSELFAENEFLIYVPSEMEILFDSIGTPTVIGYFDNKVVAYSYDKDENVFFSNIVYNINRDDVEKIDFISTSEQNVVYFKIEYYSETHCTIGSYNIETKKTNSKDIFSIENRRISSSYIMYSSYHNSLYIVLNSYLEKEDSYFEVYMDLYSLHVNDDEMFQPEYVLNIETDFKSLGHSVTGIVENQASASAFFSDSYGNIFIAYVYSNPIVGSERESYFAVVSGNNIKKTKIVPAAYVTNYNWSIDDFFIIDDNIYYIETHYDTETALNGFYICRLDHNTGKTYQVKFFELPIAMQPFMIEISESPNGLNVIWVAKDTINVFCYLNLK